MASRHRGGLPTLALTPWPRPSDKAGRERRGGWSQRTVLASMSATSPPAPLSEAAPGPGPGHRRTASPSASASVATPLTRASRGHHRQGSAAGLAAVRLRR